MKEVYKVVKLLFRSPFHIHRSKGDYDTSEEMLHSDTISSALAAMGYRLYDSFDGLDFLNNITISSAFPFYEKQYFLPKPMMRIPIKIDGYSKEESSAEAKKLKKLKYIEKSIFEKIIHNDEDILVPPGMFCLDGKYLTYDPIKKFIDTSTQQRVRVPTDGGDAIPYYVERIYFNQKDTTSGLYFFVQAEDRYFQTFIELLHLLGEEGIGTDRAVGNGHFNIELDKVEIELPDSSYRLNLSLYWPKQEEVKGGILKNSSYNIVKRGGFIAGYDKEEFRHLRKNSVFMFTEGSVFTSEDLKGNVGDLRPSWDDPTLGSVYRSGRSFSIPVHIKEE